ncbi:MAG: AsmA-like C-terminal domain-containing protein [Arcobacteraceae bacterium]
MNKLLTAIFLILLLIVAALYVKIRYFGVSIDNFRFNSYYVEQLYIKLDDKLTLTAQKIEIDKIEETTDEDIDIKQTVTYIWEILKYFNKIEIGMCNIKDEEFSISYNKEKFFFDNNIITVNAQPTLRNHIIELDIEALLIKNYNITTSGKIKIDLDKLDMNYFGDFNYDVVAGSLGINVTKNYIDFFIDTKGIENIKFVKNFVDLHPTIEQWMYDSVFGEYSLEYLKGRFDLVQETILINSLEGKANVKNAKIRFHEKLDFVNTENIEVIYQNNTLSFNLTNPIYKNISIDGSFVEISDLVDAPKPTLLVNIKTDYLLDNKILNILKAYDIDIPLIQENGNTQASVMIKVDLTDSTVHASGAFDINNAYIKIGNFDFFARKGNVLLQDYLIQVKNFDASIKDLIDATGNMTIDTNTQMIKGTGNITNFKVKAQKNEIINIANHTTDFSYDLTNSTLKLDNLAFTLQQKNDFFDIKLDNLLLLKPYLNKDLDLSNIQTCSLNLKFKDYSDIVFDTLVTFKDSILYKTDEQIKSFNFKGSYKNDKLSLIDSNNTISMTMNDDKINIDLKEYDLRYKDTQDDTDDEYFKYTLTINSTNGKLSYNDSNILSDNFKLVKTGYDTTFISNYLNSTIEVKKHKNSTQIIGKNLNDKFVNTFIDKNIIKNGIVNLDLQKSNSKDSIYLGTVNIEESTLQNIALLNNLLTFVETSPAIINPLLAIPSAYRALKDGIGYDGFLVKNGHLNVTYDTKNNVFNIYEGYLQGSRSDLVGNLQIDRKNRLLDGNISVVILKDYTKVVKHIPVIGYIFLGDDESVTLSTKVSGDIDDPKVETFATSDALNGATNILKRIITSPLKIFE